MKTALHRNSPLQYVVYPDIVTDPRTHVDTNCAAFWMNRKPQTLRQWASSETGPIRPHRVHGRLAWSVCEIRNLLLGGGAK